MSVMPPNYPIRFPFAPDIVMWRVVAACRRKSMTGPAIFPVDCGLAGASLQVLRRSALPGPKGDSGVILVPWLTGIIRGQQTSLSGKPPAADVQDLKCPRSRTPIASLPPSCSRLRASRHRPGVQDLRAYRAERAGPVARA